MMVPATLHDRFWCHVEPEPNSGCWIWIGALRRKGYGLFRVGARNMGAHRIAYELSREPIPFGLQIDHLCRNTRCVNPGHMEVVTPRENTLRGIGVTAVLAKKTECVRGHRFDEANTRHTPQGTRHCRACGRDRNRARDPRARRAARALAQLRRMT